MFPVHFLTLSLCAHHVSHVSQLLVVVVVCFLVLCSQEQLETMSSSLHA